MKTYTVRHCILGRRPRPGARSVGAAGKGINRRNKSNATGGWRISFVAATRGNYEQIRTETVLKTGIVSA